MDNSRNTLITTPRRALRLMMLLALWAALLHPAQGQFTQQGKASYYADKFQGRSTASGERYAVDKHTCAHMSLPFGTVLEVVNIKSGQTTLVRVNDRGPFSPDRIIDVSRAAAQELGLLGAGVIEVKITTVPASRLAESGQAGISPVETTTTQTAQETTGTKSETVREKPEQVVVQPPVSPVVQSNTSKGESTEEQQVIATLYALQVSQVPGGGFGVQVASYNTLVNLLNRIMSMPPAEQKLIRVMVDEQSTPSAFKLILGPFRTKNEAQQQKESFSSKYPGCFIVTL